MDDDQLLRYSRHILLPEIEIDGQQKLLDAHVLSIGEPKVESARRTLSRINPESVVTAIAERVAGARLEQLVQSADVILDCTDNFATRHAINRACVRFAKPLVSGAGVRFDGQVAVFDLRRADSPCYHCLFPESSDLEEMRCAVMGVFAPLVGIIGSIQAAEALKLLMGVGRDLTGRLLLLDALTMEWRRQAPAARCADDGMAQRAAQ